jgi:hypothetical protein
MAENQTSETPDRQVFDLDDPSIKTTYANTTHIIVGQGDVSITFGFQAIEARDNPATNLVRVVMTHDSFMRMMEFWATRYHFLNTLYGGKPKTLRDMDTEVVNAEFAKMLGTVGEEDKQDEPETGSSGNGKSADPK